MRLDTLAERIVTGVVAASGPPGHGDEPLELSLEDTLDLFDQLDVFDELLALPEAQGRWRLKSTPKARQSLDIPVGPAVRHWVAGVEIPSLAARSMPSQTDTAWRLEQTVDAVSSIFEHFLSWTVGALVDDCNMRLESIQATTRLRRDTAWCIRHGVDTQLALSLLAQGIRSRRLAHRIGRAGAKSLMTADGLREWLTELHIAGWRTQFEAGPREILDVLEYTRSRQQNLLRTLIGEGTATVDIRRTDTSPADMTRRQVRIVPADIRPAELQVIDGDVQVGVVDAAQHADVEAVLASGLEVIALLSGNTVSLTDADNPPQRRRRRLLTPASNPTRPIPSAKTSSGGWGRRGRCTSRRGPGLVRRG